MRKNDAIKFTFVFLIGICIGSIGLGTATAEETPVPVVVMPEPQGEILKICIDKKTGVMRASSSCKKTERATVLGGVGPKGDKGDTGATGATGAQGERGFVGATGATGSVSGLRTESIDFLSGSSFGCPGYGTSKTVLTDIQLRNSTLLGTTSLYPTTTRLYGCTATVYVR